MGEILPTSLLGAATVIDPHPLFTLPFAALLLCIATMPLLLPKVWEHHFKKICLGFGLAYCGLLRCAERRGGIHRRLGMGGGVSFISFIGSFQGRFKGIHVRTKGEAIPSVNAAISHRRSDPGQLITTGVDVAHPPIRMNKYRFTTFHTAFFIFIVSNVGGCLTPIGDPPLFLGYLKGVPFWWVTAKCLPAWALAVSCIVTVFYALDRVNFLAAPKAIREKQTQHEEFKIEGLHNFGWLAIVLAAVFLKQPPGLREALMVIAAIGSYKTTPRPIHDANHFSFVSHQGSRMAVCRGFLPRWCRHSTTSGVMPGRARYFHFRTLLLA